MKLIFDANPLLGKKTGVGYLTESLVECISNKYGNDVEFIGHYFNFLGLKDESGLPKSDKIRYKRSILFPTKLLNILRKIGIELPYEIFTKTKADVHLFTNFVSMPSLFKTSTALFIHDLSFVDLPQYVASRNGEFLRRFVPKSLKRATSVFTISEFTKKRIIEEYKYDRSIIVIPVPPEKIKETRVDKLINLKIPEKFLLFVGTLEPRKNIQNLLDAYSNIYKSTSISLVLVGGKGWNDESIEQKIQKLKEEKIPLITTGYVTESEKTALYKNATLYIQPSHYEGFGMPILEAMNMGAPVACSNIPVFKEVAAEAAVYFNQNDITDIQNKVISLLKNDNELSKLRVLSKKRINEYPDWDKVAELVYKNFVKSNANK